MQERIDELERLLAEAYQAVSVLAEDAGRWGDEDVERMMDNLAEGRFVHDNVLPFGSKQTSASVAFNKGWNAALEQIEVMVCEMNLTGCEVVIDDSMYKTTMKKGMRIALCSVVDQTRAMAVKA